ncbi:hypothetical protein BaRGS_00016343, partial [Batillaria attramentaria]
RAIKRGYGDVLGNKPISDPHSGTMRGAKKLGDEYNATPRPSIIQQDFTRLTVNTGDRQAALCRYVMTYSPPLKIHHPLLPDVTPSWLDLAILTLVWGPQLTDGTASVTDACRTPPRVNGKITLARSMSDAGCHLRSNQRQTTKEWDLSDGSTGPCRLLKDHPQPVSCARNGEFCTVRLLHRHQEENNMWCWQQTERRETDPGVVDNNQSDTLALAADEGGHRLSCRSRYKLVDCGQLAVSTPSSPAAVQDAA